MTPEPFEDTGSLSVRSYTLAQNTHSHGHPQVVVPLNGTMKITFGERTYSAAPGHCVIIPSGTVHRYSASEPARFLVADMVDLPANALAVAEPCVAIKADLLAFCVYAETQLKMTVDAEISGLLYRLFWRLLAEQDFASRVDDRITRAVMKMEADLGVTHSIEELAATAYLSVSQFKALFKRNLGMSCSAFLTNQRMARAKTLLTNTDYPVNVVAIEVGYEDPSAFSRRFRAHFGQSPRELARGR